MDIYLAARYIRRPEMERIAHELQAMGHTVTSRWVFGAHDTDGGSESEKMEWAIEDIADLQDAHCCISFTEEPRKGLEKPGRGGRHVEFGFALAFGRRVIVVGPRENIFHFLPRVEHYETWEEARQVLAPARFNAPKIG